MATFTFDSVMHNVRAIHNFHSDRQIAEWLGLSQSAFANRKRSKSTPHAELLVRLVAEEIDLNHFFYGLQPDSGLPPRLNAAGAVPAFNAPPMRSPPVHLEMRESALRMLRAALHALETLHDYEQGLTNGTQD